MVYAEKPEASEKDFLELLDRTRHFLLRELPVTAVITPGSFELMVYQQMREAAVGTTFEGTIRQTGALKFPDVIAREYFGVEVKLTIGDHWTSIGNSVTESLREEGAERIYIMFGKLGGTKDVKYRLYQECLPEVSVTHSPRYKIDMNLPVGESIFDKLGLEYDSLRKGADPIKEFKKYYKSKLKDGEELWWIDKDETPVLRNFKLLPPNLKEEFIVDSLILFPEIYNRRKWTKYERPAGYLITQYGAFTASFRDKFSAGGKIEKEIAGIRHLIPQIAENVYNRAKAIEERLGKIDKDTLAENWHVDPSFENPVEAWKEIVDREFASYNAGITLSRIFDAGL